MKATIVLSAMQDEVKAAQRLTVAGFLVGFLGVFTTMLLDFVVLFTRKAGVRHANNIIKAVLRAVAPHYVLSRCVHWHAIGGGGNASALSLANECLCAKPCTCSNLDFCPACLRLAMPWPQWSQQAFPISSLPIA